MFQLKGSDGSKVKAQVEEIIKEVGLEFKKKTQSARLSGGQKRKLSVGIALISGSKVIDLLSPGGLVYWTKRRNRRYRLTLEVRNLIYSNQ